MTRRRRYAEAARRYLRIWQVAVFGHPRELPFPAVVTVHFLNFTVIVLIERAVQYVLDLFAGHNARLVWMEMVVLLFLIVLALIYLFFGGVMLVMHGVEPVAMYAMGMWMRLGDAWGDLKRQRMKRQRGTTNDNGAGQQQREPGDDSSQTQR